MYEEERILTIRKGLSKQRKPIPIIVLQGDWLRKLGYIKEKKVSMKIINQNDVIKLNISLLN